MGTLILATVGILIAHSRQLELAPPPPLRAASEDWWPNGIEPGGEETVDVLWRTRRAAEHLPRPQLLREASCGRRAITVFLHAADDVHMRSQFLPLFLSWHLAASTYGVNVTRLYGQSLLPERPLGVPTADECADEMRETAAEARAAEDMDAIWQRYMGTADDWRLPVEGRDGYTLMRGADLVVFVTPRVSLDSLPRTCEIHTTAESADASERRECDGVCYVVPRCLLVQLDFGEQDEMLLGGGGEVVSPELMRYAYGGTLTHLATRRAAAIVSRYASLTKVDFDGIITPSFSFAHGPKWTRPDSVLYGEGTYLFQNYTIERLRAAARSMGLHTGDDDALEVGSGLVARGKTMVRLMRLATYVLVRLWDTRTAGHMRRDDPAVAWPRWWPGVATMYATGIAANHLARYDAGGQRRLQSNAGNFDITASQWEHESHVGRVSFVHTFTGELFNKEMVAAGRFDEAPPTGNMTIVANYCGGIAHFARRYSTVLLGDDPMTLTALLDLASRTLLQNK